MVSHPSCHPPPKKKTESQASGEEEKNLVQELPPYMGLRFLGGGMKDESPCIIMFVYKEGTMWVSTWITRTLGHYF